MRSGRHLTVMGEDAALASGLGFGSLTTPTLHHVGMYVVLFLLHSNSESLRYNLRATVQGSFFIKCEKRDVETREGAERGAARETRRATTVTEKARTT